MTVRDMRRRGRWWFLQLILVTVFLLALCPLLAGYLIEGLSELVFCLLEWLRVKRDLYEMEGDRAMAALAGKAVQDDFSVDYDDPHKHAPH